MAANPTPVYTSQPGGQAPMVYETPDDIQRAPTYTSTDNNDHIEKVNITQETSPPTKPQYHESIIEPVAKPAQVTPLTQLGESEATIACPHCKYRAKTKVSTEDTNMTTICGVLLCLICVCAACLPCLCGWFQDVHHACSHCGKRVATRRQDGSIQVYEPKDMDNLTYYPDAPPKEGQGAGEGEGVARPAAVAVKQG